MASRGRYLLACFKYAGTGSVSRANTLSTLVGAALLYGLNMLTGWKIPLPDGIPGLFVGAFYCFAAMWIVILIVRFVGAALHFALEPHKRPLVLLKQRLGQRMGPVLLMAAGLFCFVTLSGSGLIWLLVQTSRGAADVPVTAAPNSPLGPASEPIKTVVVSTAPEDVPKKLKAIDSFEEILRDELAPIVQKGMQLSTGGWRNDMVAGKAQELREKTLSWRNAQANLAQRLRVVRDQSGRFPDIQALYDPSYENAFNPAMERFVSAVGNLGDEKWNTETLVFFMQPIADNCYKQLNNIESWRRDRLRAAIELRKKFSQ